MCKNKLVSLLGIVILSGCQYPVRQTVDSMVCKDVFLDAAPAPANKMQSSPVSGSEPIGIRSDRGIDSSSGLLQTSAQDQPKQLPMLERLLKKVEPGSGVPGSEQLDIPLAPLAPKDKRDQAEYIRAAQEAARKYLKDLPPLAPEPKPALAPHGLPLSLADLQKIARDNSPLLRQAAANIEAAKGAAFQAGTYPNPTLALTGITAGPSGGPNLGPNVTQTFITAGKKTLAQAAGAEDARIAELAYHRAEADLAWKVRSGYFAVLVAQEAVRANRALVNLADEVYHAMVKQFAGGESAMYEPLQLGVFASQVRGSLIQARNAYTVAWKTLASTLGLPGLPPTELAPERLIALRVPAYLHEEVLAHVLQFHTDVRTAQENIKKARYDLRLAQVTPIPDLNATLGGFYDNNQGNGPFRAVGMFNVSCAIPVWDQNRGTIHQQQGVLVQMNEEPHRVRTILSANFADAFRRYDESRDLLRMYQENILTKQVQAFRAALRLYNVSGTGLAYLEIISSEQNLVTNVGGYLTILGNLWQAVADVSNLLQTDDIFQVSSANVEPVSMLDLEAMIQCCHPCSKLPNPSLKTLDPHWPRSGRDILAPSPERTEFKFEPKQPMPLPMPPEVLPDLPMELGPANPSQPQLLPPQTNEIGHSPQQPMPTIGGDATPVLEAPSFGKAR